MDRKIRAKIIGTGSYTPPTRVTNADMEKIVDTSDDWIVSRTGIKERRIVAGGMTTSDMAVEACKQALDMAACSSEEIELVIVGTVTPDYRLPSAACVIQEKMNLPNAVAFDVSAACTGFINGLSIASSFIETGVYRKALVVGAETLSSITNYADRSTCVLFGDGAGAVVVSREAGDAGVLATFMRSDGNLRELLWMEVGGVVNPYTREYQYDGRDKIFMDGSDVFKVAVKEMSNASLAVIEKAGLKPSDVSIVIPHQANIRIIDALTKRLKMDREKVFVNIEKYGNTSAASVPIALNEANRTGRIKPGDHVLMVAFGGGLIWGSALVRW